MEKKPELEAAILGKSPEENKDVNQANPWAASSNPNTSNDQAISDNKLSWQQQKQEQARIRKIKNDLKRTEDEIHQLENRNDEIDNLLIQEEIFTDPHRLMELHEEKKQVEAKLDQLLIEWDSWLLKNRKRKSPVGKYYNIFLHGFFVLLDFHVIYSINLSISIVLVC